jgi:hypothetical protein
VGFLTSRKVKGLGVAVAVAVGRIDPGKAITQVKWKLEVGHLQCQVRGEQGSGETGKAATVSWVIKQALIHVRRKTCSLTVVGLSRKPVTEA